MGDKGEGSSSRRPLVVLVVGMAGTGKTTFVQRMQEYYESTKVPAYYINLDPGVTEVPFGCRVDIRDSVNYREVMKQYRLGPNGAILTALNLFATKIHQVVSLLEAKADQLEVVLVDTPGQIEVFTWSASGQLIMEAFASTFPTCVVFLADATRCINPQTFMSTMLYASSIMFKSQLPLLLVLNKIDIVKGDFMFRWMRDPQELQDVLRDSHGYAATLTQSLSLFLKEFYEGLKCATVSAMTGENVPELHAKLATARSEYETAFVPLMARRAQEQRDRQESRARDDAQRIAKDRSADTS